MDPLSDVKVEYERDRLRNSLRDTVAMRLIPACMASLNSNGRSGELINYVSSILEYSTKSKLTVQELENLGCFRSKFAFFQYVHNFDRNIHGMSYYIVALCHGYYKIVEKYVKPWRILDSKCKYGNPEGEGFIGVERANALCKDVAKLAKDCMQACLMELQETGKVRTSAELARDVSLVNLTCSNIIVNENVVPKTDMTNSQNVIELNPVNQDMLLAPTEPKEDEIDHI